MAAIIDLHHRGAVEGRLRATLDALASFGDKRAGSPGNARCVEWLVGQLRAAGLHDVHVEEFAFPSFEALGSSLIASGSEIAHEPLAYSGAGTARGELLHVGTGEPADYEGQDARGRIVVVERNVTYHRSAQYREACARGAAALVYVSHAPDNLVQCGTIADPEDGLGPIPAVSVGERDGKALRGEAVVRVDGRIGRGIGRNVVGELQGGAEQLLVGAHHDTWHIGSTDNGTGIAVLLELAAQLAELPRQRTLRFVAYDGEELNLFGGYDYLRKHVVERGERVAAFVNLEIPGAGADDVRALAVTPAVDSAVRAAGLDELYPVCVGMELVPSLFGGVIPTDIQGAYRHRLAGACTACDTPWYHTRADTPDKVDLPFLARATTHWRRAIELLDKSAATEDDENRWPLEVQAEQGAEGVIVTAISPRAAGATLDAWVCVDDFTRVARAQARFDVHGRCTLTLRHRGQGWLHATAGEAWPLAERIVRLR